MRQALSAVKQAMGPDAMVLSSRNVSKGFLSRPWVEITATVEEPRLTAPAAEAKSSENLAALQGLLAPIRRELRALQSSVRNAPPSDATALRRLNDDLQQILSLLSAREVPARTDSFEGLLLAADVEAGLAHKLAEDARRKNGESPNSALDPGVLIGVVAEHLPILDLSRTSGRTVIALVGPTGVGKTTTIAKLAANAALICGRRAALVTLDTYRVGAVEQLRQYADLIRIPMEVCRDAKGFNEALLRNADADTIFVDTAGRGPDDAGQIPALREVLQRHEVRILLTLSAATRRQEARSLLERFRALPATGVVLTKLDEAHAFGAALNLIEQSRLPLTHVTFGQKVPEDVTEPDARTVAELVVNHGRHLQPGGLRQLFGAPRALAIA